MDRPRGVRAEIRQNRPFASKGQEATVALLKTADVVKRSITRVLEPHDLTLQQFNVLRILRGAGEGGLPTLDVLDRLIETAPGVTRLLDRLEAKGLVRRERCRSDRRQVLCFVTKKGLDLVGALDRPVLEADDELAAVLGPSKLKTLVLLLDEIRAAHARREP